MDSAKNWLNKFQPKDKTKSSNKRRDDQKTGNKLPINEEPPSNATKQRVAAAKQYIETHYKEQMKSLKERRERYALKFWCWFLPLSLEDQR